MSEQRRGRLGGWRLAFRTRSGHAHGIMRLWILWEWLWMRTHRIVPIPGAEGGLFHAQFARYHGRPITLPDGTRATHGDRVVIVHIANHALAEATARALSWDILRRMALDLRALAAWARTPDFPSDTRALFGVTVISRAAPRLGFTVRERPQTLKTWLDRQFLLGLLLLYHPHGARRILEGTTHHTHLAEVWMSLGELERRYGAPADPPSEPDHPRPQRSATERSATGRALDAAVQ